MRLDEITLIKETETLDTIGQPVVSTTTNTVIAEIKSVTRNEFFQGRQGGITPDILFEISVFDYDGKVEQHKICHLPHIRNGQRPNRTILPSRRRRDKWVTM